MNLNEDKVQGLVDTHCHIHTASSGRGDFTAKKWHEAGETSAAELLDSAKASGVDKLICVGTDYEDSVEVAEFVQNREGCWASIGVHPHEAKQFLHAETTRQRAEPSASSPGPASEREGIAPMERFQDLLKRPKVVAVGEVGLDYYYEHSPKKEQIKLLEMFLDLAQKNDLPVIFHVREAFDDFWPILANFNIIRGVLHSFTSNEKNLNKAMERGLFVGLNGIITFTKDQSQLEVAKKVSLNSLLLETDAPYLAPKPLRGKICKPEYVSLTYEFLCRLRGEDEDVFVSTVSANANRLFGI